jgi:hypothetical protein
VFLPLFCGRSHHVSPQFVCLSGLFKQKSHPLVASRGSAPDWGTGSRSWPWGAPPGGVPGADPSTGPGLMPQAEQRRPRGGPGGAPGGPRGGLCGAQGASGGVRGPLPGGYPPGGARVGATAQAAKEAHRPAPPRPRATLCPKILRPAFAYRDGSFDVCSRVLRRRARGTTLVGPPPAPAPPHRAPPGGYPPGGPLVAALPTDNTALLEPPPRGAPRGGRWGGAGQPGGKIKQNPVLKSSKRGAGGAPPKAHWVRSLQGGPKRAQF